VARRPGLGTEPLTPTTDPKTWLELPEELAVALDREPLRFQHRLTGNPLLSLGSLAELTERLPRTWISHHRADVSLVTPTNELSSLDLSPREVVDGLAENSCSARLYHVQNVPGYRDLVMSCLDEVEPLLGRRGEGMSQRDASLFLGSPGAVVPAHFDLHHNLLLQVEGSKELSVGIFDDPRDHDRELDIALSRSRNLAVLPTSATTFHLEPGDGIYLPPWGVHWVQGESEVSVALSCSFSTRVTEQTELIRRWNSRLRQLGRSPLPPGRSETVDRAKAAAVRSRDRLLARRPSRRAGRTDRAR
jgi:hypothetical protein